MILFLAWLVLFPTGASVYAGTTEDAKVYSLNEIYRLALERSEQVGISGEDLFLAQLTRKKAFAVLVP